MRGEGRGCTHTASVTARLASFRMITWRVYCEYMACLLCWPHHTHRGQQHGLPIRAFTRTVVGAICLGTAAVAGPSPVPSEVRIDRSVNNFGLLGRVTALSVLRMH